MIIVGHGEGMRRMNAPYEHWLPRRRYAILKAGEFMATGDVFYAIPIGERCQASSASWLSYDVISLSMLSLLSPRYRAAPYAT